MTRVNKVLATLYEERKRLSAELAEVEEAIASLEGSVARPYTMLNLYEATMHFLASAGTPKSAPEIALGLRAGGFKTRSRRFATTVTTMLSRPAARQYGIRRTRDGKRWQFRESLS